MTSRTAVEGVLARVRPFLVADGGDIQLVAVDGDEAALRRLSPALRIIQVA